MILVIPILPILLTNLPILPTLLAMAAELLGAVTLLAAKECLISMAILLIRRMAATMVLIMKLGSMTEEEVV